MLCWGPCALLYLYAAIADARSLSPKLRLVRPRLEPCPTVSLGHSVSPSGSLFLSSFEYSNGTKSLSPLRSRATPGGDDGERQSGCEHAHSVTGQGHMCVDGSVFLPHTVTSWSGMAQGLQDGVTGK